MWGVSRVQWGYGAKIAIIYCLPHLASWLGPTQLQDKAFGTNKDQIEDEEIVAAEPGDV